VFSCETVVSSVFVAGAGTFVKGGLYEDCDLYSRAGLKLLLCSKFSFLRLDLGRKKLAKGKCKARHS